MAVAKPVDLLPGHTYLHITSPHAPADLALSTTQPVTITYVGPVGELKGEHIYEVQRAEPVGPVARDSDVWKRAGDAVVRDLKEVEGVKGVKVLETRQRVKRDL